METIVGGAPRRSIQIRSARTGGMTKAKRRRFLESFAATCNATISAKAAGLSMTTIYAHKRKDPSFAAAWEEAKQAGRERLEEALLAHALRKLEPSEFDPAAVPITLTERDEGTAEAPPSPLRGRPAVQPKLGGAVALTDVQVALALVNRREAIDRRGRGGRRPHSVEEVERALGAKLDSLARRLGQEAADEAASPARQGGQ